MLALAEMTEVSVEACYVNSNYSPMSFLNGWLDAMSKWCALTADGNSAAAAPTWMASYGCPGSYPFLPSPARNHGQHKVKLCCNFRKWYSWGFSVMVISYD